MVKAAGRHGPGMGPGGMEEGHGGGYIGGRPVSKLTIIILERRFMVL